MGEYGCTPLEEACLHGRKDVVKLLLEEHNVKIDSREDFGCNSEVRFQIRGNLQIRCCDLEWKIITATYSVLLIFYFHLNCSQLYSVPQELEIDL